jgi:hypothetical protein
VKYRLSKILLFNFQNEHTRSKQPAVLTLFFVKPKKTGWEDDYDEEYDDEEEQIGLEHT